MFRNEYIGTKPYISCSPSLCHHKLCARDQFLVLSSDGLYQYLTNQEVVSHVESFMEKYPDGDPAQHLIEELLSRAAKKAGINYLNLVFLPICFFLYVHTLFAYVLIWWEMVWKFALIWHLQIGNLLNLIDNSGNATFFGWILSNDMSVGWILSNDMSAIWNLGIIWCQQNDSLLYRPYPC